MAESQIAISGGGGGGGGTDDFERFDFPDGTIFVVDVSPEMFERFERFPHGKKQQGNTYFEECISGIVRILRWKLVANRRDWMGVIFYNVMKNWDPESEHILTVLKFSQIETDALRQLLSKTEKNRKMEDYWDERLSERRDYCLKNVLRRAAECFDSIKTRMAERQAVLITRNDNPLRENAVERGKIRLQAAINGELNVGLRIVRLKESWNHELFYKNVDALANGRCPEDSRATRAADLENRSLFVAPTSGLLEWKIRRDVALPVRVTSFLSRTGMKKVCGADKETDEILEESRELGATRVLVPDCVRKSAVRYRDGSGSEEVKKILSNLQETGIRLIGFEPLSVDSIDHAKPTDFVSILKRASTKEKTCFADLLKKCLVNKVMAICAVSHRSRRYIAKAIACEKLHGFYLRETSESRGADNVDYSTEKTRSPVADHEGVLVAKKSMQNEMHTERKQPSNYSSPRFHLHLHRAYVDSLGASTGEKFDKPVDYARAENDDGTAEEERAAVSSVVASKKRPSKDCKFDEDTIGKVVKNRTLRQMNVLDLRSVARMLGVRQGGPKARLVESIEAHYAPNKPVEEAKNTLFKFVTQFKQ